MKLISTVYNNYIIEINHRDNNVKLTILLDAHFHVIDHGRVSIILQILLYNQQYVYNDSNNKLNVTFTTVIDKLADIIVSLFVIVARHAEDLLYNIRFEFQYSIQFYNDVTILFEVHSFQILDFQKQDQTSNPLRTLNSMQLYCTCPLCFSEIFVTYPMQQFQMMSIKTHIPQSPEP